MNDTDSEIESTLSKLADDKKLSGVGDRTEGWKTIHKDLDQTGEVGPPEHIEVQQVQMQGAAPKLGQSQTSTDWEKKLWRAA